MSATPPMQVVLVEPEIPPNTGNIARTCAATGSRLHLVHPLGFELSDKQLKRAGLDYWPHVDLHEHASLEDCLVARGTHQVWYFSKKATRSIYDAGFSAGDYLVFGPETRGLPEDLLDKVGAQALRIPMRGDAVRSLNLGTSVGIALFEALRQQGWG
ncbi:MAG: tRNA (cytidine(34)-2'-O)-methyltransferase [Kiritimatiellae bacterium]|jgi:tRNA (cytidine/uridine-2'-O-)-methyltransferase|nr:tRNA (cytidine(34)-2'-O)-methyltransferase [Kiritimatiellia bacterium]